jgi:hypothetical protein
MPALMQKEAGFLTKAGPEMGAGSCPITFHPRVGLSKGGNVNNWRALAVGARMIRGLLLDWRYA